MMTILRTSSQKGSAKYHGAAGTVHGRGVLHVRRSCCRDFRAGALRAVQGGAGTQLAGDFHHQDPGLYQSGDLGAVQHIHGRGGRTVPAHQSAGGLQAAADSLPAYDAKVFRLAHVLRKAVAVSGDVSHRYRDICSIISLALNRKIRKVPMDEALKCNE